MVVSSDLFYSCFMPHPWVTSWDTSQVAFHLYADDTPLTSESSSAELAKLAVEDYCVRDIDAWMTVNKLKMNRDKTELVVLNASHRQPSPLTSISVCDEVISNSSVATILVTNLETLLCVFLPQCWFGYYNRLSAPKYTFCSTFRGRRWALLSENKCVKSECKKIKRKFKGNGFCFNDLWQVL